LLAAGASEVIVAGDDDLVARVKQVTAGRGVDLVFDALGGDGVHALAAATSPRGLMLIYGFLYTPHVAGSFGSVATPLPFTNWSVAVRWFAAQDVTRDDEGRRRSRQFVHSGLASGALAPIVDRTFPLAEIAAAHRHLEANTHIGKVVVTI
jgi:NADPH:quinone reductase-like Zn-dependent oxidoreductase